jgi:hypothetical protein
MALYVVPKYTTRGRWLSFYGWQQMALYVVPKKVLRGSLLDHHFLVVVVSLWENSQL